MRTSSLRAYFVFGSTQPAKAWQRCLANLKCSRRPLSSDVHFEKGLTAIFQIKTSTAIRLFEQAFHFLRSRDQIVHFGYLALREYLPAAECWDPSAESVEKVPHLINSEPRSLGHIDDCQVVEDAAFIAALPTNALSFREQANLLVVPDCRGSQTCPARHFANGYVRHIKRKVA